MVKLSKGLTLLELLIAITLLSVVLITASSMLISFKKFYVDFTQRQGEVQEVSLGVLKEMANRVNVANKILIATPPTRAIFIYIDNTDPSDPADDTIYEYFLNGDRLLSNYKIGANPWSVLITKANHIGLLEFQFYPAGSPSANQVKISIGVTPASGPQQNFDMIATARARAAE